MGAQGSGVRRKMRDLVPLFVVLLAASAACNDEERRTAPTVQPNVPAAPATDGSFAASSAGASASAPAPPKIGKVVIDPAIPAREMGMMDHCKALGWSRDSRYLGCTSATPADEHPIAYDVVGPAPAGSIGATVYDTILDDAAG